MYTFFTAAIHITLLEIINIPPQPKDSQWEAQKDKKQNKTCKDRYSNKIIPTKN